MARVAKLASRPSRILPPEGRPFHIRIAGALQPREDGFIGIDSVKTDSVDYVVDLKSLPWPIDDAAVDRMFALNYLHRLTGVERVAFMNEVWRVLKVGGQLQLAQPHWSSMRSISDPTVAWPPLCEASFMFFNREWRERENIDYGITCDFDFGYGLGLDPEIQVRNQEYQQHATKYWNNAALDLHVTLTKKK